MLNLPGYFKMIKEYRFGSITIDNKSYNYDVEVRWDGEVLKWWRGESHIIDVEDIKRAVEQSPDTIIIGTGESGLAKVTEAVQKFVAEKEIKLVVDVTREAVRTFNVIHQTLTKEQGKQGKVIGLFHLTC